MEGCESAGLVFGLYESSPPFDSKMKDDSMNTADTELH